MNNRMSYRLPTPHVAKVVTVLSLNGFAPFFKFAYRFYPNTRKPGTAGLTKKD
jgi:hypothetical protein